MRPTRGGHVPTGTAAGRRARSTTSITIKGERTRRSVIDAARKVFESSGYLDARVSDIVAMAGLSHGSFYTYFPSKLEVFQAIIAEVGQQITNAVGHTGDDLPGDILGNLDRANRRYLKVHRENARILAEWEQAAGVDPSILAARIAARNRHVNRVAATIMSLQERSLADRTLDPHTTAAALVAMLSNLTYWWSLQPTEFDEESIARTVTAIWSRALALQSHADEPARSRSR